MIAKVQKKYKHMKKALNASQCPNELTAKELIPYPPGRPTVRGVTMLQTTFLRSLESPKRATTLLSYIAQPCATVTH